MPDHLRASIRLNVGGTPVEIKLWRLAVWLAWFGFFCLLFDSYVCSWWAEVPVEVAFGALLEWAFPAFGLYPVLTAAREDLREIRRLRAELAEYGAAPRWRRR
jgi:hypothetical protein